MRIHISNLTLRFYKVDGWNESKVKRLLVNPKMQITYRKDNRSKDQKEILGDLSYYAVYENSGYEVFKESEIRKHQIVDNQNFGGVDWYIKEGI